MDPRVREDDTIYMSIYADLILDHYQNPRNNILLTSEVSKSEIQSINVSNPLCGDKLHMELSEKDGVVEHIGFTGDGCAISIASASMLTEYAKGKNNLAASGGGSRGASIYCKHRICARCSTGND